MLAKVKVVVPWRTLSVVVVLLMHCYSVQGWLSALPVPVPVPVLPGVPNTRGQEQRSAITRHQLAMTTTPTSTTTTNEETEQQEQPGVLDGVSEFEQWFQTLGNKANCDASIRHGAFGTLRGLQQLPASVAASVASAASVAKVNGRLTVATVPKTAVLMSSYADKDWDSQLAVMLWKECIKGEQSDIYGYCALLTRGQTLNSDASTSVPPSTAPNTLRHWTDDQLDLLSDLSPRGQKLRQVQTDQEQAWRNKYEQIKIEQSVSTTTTSSSTSSSTPNMMMMMTWEQFEWCMEVVHSRAFRGNYSTGSMQSMATSAAAPLIAAAVGMAYMQGNPNINDAVLLSLGAFATMPLLWNALLRKDDDAAAEDGGGGEVVLLPLIDSANHLEGADSGIQYDPLRGVFSLSVGSKCFVREGDATQLYISYGPRSNGELLLNYGFLPGVSFSSHDDNESFRDAYRRRLAEEYSKRGQ